MRVTAVHEAGHAVIAAYLRIPFKDVSVTLGKMRFFHRGGRDSDSIIPKNDNESFWRRYAIVGLASRAAVDEILPGQETDKDAYSSDEYKLAKTAEVLGVNEDAFPAWREALLNEARRLVALRDIRATIISLAAELDKPMFATVIPAREVRAKLKSACVASQEAEAHAKPAAGGQ